MYTSPYFSPERVQTCSAGSGTPAEGPHNEYQSLLELPGFKYYSQDFLAAFQELYFAKPILIQDHVAHDPWKFLRAVMLLNKTRGAKTVPINDPPRPDLLRKWRCKTNVYSSIVADSVQNVVAEETGYKRTPAAHLPGCGPYALDSWRIFCAGNEEWMSVLPKDKELKKFLRWKWAYEEFPQWDPELGPSNVITLNYVRDPTALLSNE
ncbi:hypothetical protein BKA93DRAFT_824855 [Sparassis latifolia]